jgi:hypothetical protein
MADRPSRQVKAPERFSCNFSTVSKIKDTTNTKRDRKLYDIEVVEVDREVKRVKIHYVGYSKQYDKWRPYGIEGQYFPFIRSEKLVIPTPESLEDRKQAFHGHLYREIKKKLWSMRREDPDICIDLNTDQDVFEAGLGSVVPGRLYQGEMVYTPRSNRLLDSILGQKWDERILNQNILNQNKTDIPLMFANGLTM